MAGRIVFFEGLPGAGKSTLLHDTCRAMGGGCAVYREETSQPLDLFRQAVLPREALARAADAAAGADESARRELAAWLSRHSWTMGELAVVAYTRTGSAPEAAARLAAGLKRYDLGDGRVPFSVYERLHVRTWERFRTQVFDGETCYLSEGALFHNQLFDLIGFYRLTEGELLGYYERLLDALGPIELQVQYVDVDDVSHLIGRTEAQRPGWRGQTERWLAHAPWALERGCTGHEGLLALYETLRRTHRLLCRELRLETHCHLRHI